jgi:hypothetical protein
MRFSLPHQEGINEIQVTQILRTLQTQNALFREENILLRKENEQLNARMV